MLEWMELSLIDAEISSLRGQRQAAKASGHSGRVNQLAGDLSEAEQRRSRLVDQLVSGIADRATG